jgi:hypothetical protein
MFLSVFYYSTIAKIRFSSIANSVGRWRLTRLLHGSMRLIVGCQYRIKQDSEGLTPYVGGAPNNEGLPSQTVRCVSAVKEEKIR